ncbi:hypothetical protein DIURU_005319 [Diutina rugosa]|uniref:Acyl-coenzyme A oxidase n=1 Tax=Diutina rugosa TaxID=5481 RepID=A0A642UE05_DIURU|nr:uncharacterized protein DIURU_005319 [Diutina rugosa]KAA8897342.1 hypothetical protein DIURU_005319 [Diutina rugosa]
MVSVTNRVNTSPPQNPRSLLQKERDQSAWDPVKMNYFLEGSQQRSEAVANILQSLERDPVLAVGPESYDETKAEQRETTARRIDRLMRYLETESTDDFHTRLSLVGITDPGLSTRIAVHLMLWIPAINGNGTFEQRNYWLKDKSEHIRDVYGCFGMTELAHGSNVPGMQTTATFDEETDEFIINTPHIGATKWWIGGAAHSATHCATYARLIVKGKDYGVKVFVVPLRDADFNLNPGVTVGDIGAKMGRDGIDNGWIQYSNVRIPRFFMLQKFCQVDRNGEVTLPPLEQLSYSALLGGRVGMVTESYRTIARMITIALRYAIGRTQFPKTGNPQEEQQIIDYSLHQRRLFPYLSAAYVISATAYKYAQVIKQVMHDIDAAVADSNMKALGKAINDLKELFVDSGSCKSNLTWITADCIAECRQACGGHGYSAYNGFGRAFADWHVMCTWEGDNNILGVHVGKSILKQYIGAVQKGKAPSNSIKFLAEAPNYTGDKGKETILKTPQDVLDLNKFARALEVGMMRLSHRTAGKLKQNNGDLDNLGPELVLLTRLRAHHCLITEYADRLAKHSDNSTKPYLELMGQNYAAAFVLQQVSTLFLTYNLIDSEVFGDINSDILPALAQKIRPHIVTYTDSFQLSDNAINSAIGKWDGNLYENYFNVVCQQNPPKNTHAPYSEILEKAIARGPLDRRDRYEKTGEAAKQLSK